jgi:hypothetical protein
MTNEIGNTEADVVIPELWLEAQDLIKALYSASRIPMRVMRLDDRAKFYGDVIHIVAVPTATIGAVGADGTLANQALTLTENQLSVSRWRGNQITILNRASKQAKIDLFKAYVETMKGVAVQDVENYVLSLHASLTGTAVGDELGEAGEDLLAAAVQNALNAELGEKLEDPEAMSWFFHTSQWDSLHKADFVKQYNVTGQTGGAAMPIRREKSIWGIPVFFSTQVASASYQSGTIRANMLAAREALALAVQKEIGVNMIPVAALAKGYAVDVLYGASVGAPTRGFVVRTKA